MEIDVDYTQILEAIENADTFELQELKGELFEHGFVLLQYGDIDPINLRKNAKLLSFLIGVRDYTTKDEIIKIIIDRL